MYPLRVPSSLKNFFFLFPTNSHSSLFSPLFPISGPYWWHCPVLSTHIWLLTAHVPMTLPTSARLANGFKALTNGMSRSHPCSRPFSHSSGDIIINMNPEANVKKIDTVVKLDAVSFSMMPFKIHLK